MAKDPALAQGGHWCGGRGTPRPQAAV